MVVNWYRKNLGTPYELAPLPTLYQKYAARQQSRLVHDEPAGDTERVQTPF
jgi:hypothetical protein